MSSFVFMAMSEGLVVVKNAGERSSLKRGCVIRCQSSELVHCSLAVDSHGPGRDAQFTGQPRAAGDVVFSRRICQYDSPLRFGKFVDGRLELLPLF